MDSVSRAWRQRRKAGSRIPPPLWALAVRLANRHGVSRTAAVLGVDYHRLKKRVEAAASQASSSGPAFVELPAPVVVGKQCLCELANGAGASMRVQLLGYEAADVDYLTQLQRHAEQVAANPERWLPWNYRAALDASSAATT